MFKSSSSAIHKQCQKCGMQFDNFEQLATHHKRFCTDGDYGTLSKLELKHMEYMKNTPINVFTGKNSLLSPNPSNIPDSKRTFDLNIPMIQSREIQMQDDINRIKDEKKSLRMRRQQEEEAFVELLREVEHKTDRDLRARIEKDLIRKDITDLEKIPGNRANELEKKRHLENLLAERELLKQKELYLIQDIAKFDTEIRLMDRVNDKPQERTNDILDEFKRKVGDTFKAKEAMLIERSNKINELKHRKDINELERKRILEDRERINNGEFALINKRNNASFANNFSPAKNTASPLRSHELDAWSPSPQRVNQVPFNNSPQRVEGSGSSMLPRSPSLFSNNANNILSLNGLPPAIPHHNHNVNYGQQPAPSLSDLMNSNPQCLEDVLHLRSRYINGGGKDPMMFQNLENLEQFYRGLGARQNHKMLEAENEKANNDQLEVLKQKEEEGNRLRKEIEMLKMQGRGPPGAGGNETLTLTNMNLKLNGIGGQNGNMFGIYNAEEEFFLQNEARNVELNEGERMAINISAQEIDALRVLSQIPIGTELYRFKLEQFKELSTSRGEMDKILMEHMLLKMRRDFEKKRRDEDRMYENNKWVDEQRKNIIGNRLRRDLNPAKVSKGYDPTEGLIIHWDYLLSVPKKNDSCQVVYGIYINGNEVYPPSMVEPHPTEIDTSVTNRCIFGKSHPVTEIPANANALLIFEVQLFPSKDSENLRLTSFGWSQLDLFDAKRELKRGKFKVPLYECPTDTNQDIDGIRDLTPVQNGVSWLYLRISYPFDDEVGKVQSIYPENTHMEYNIPQIHLRNFRVGMEGQFSIPPPAIEYTQNLPPPTRQSTTSTNSRNGNGNDMYPPGPPYQEPPQQPPQTPPRLNPGFGNGQPSQSQSGGGRKEPLTDNDSERSESPPLNQTARDPGEKKALQFVIHAIRGHVARSHLKISCALYEEDIIVIDDEGQKCVYNTTTHNPLDIARKDLSMSVASAVSKMSNKAQGQDIIFKEDHTFKKDLNRLITKNFGKKDYYLMFQVLEKPEPTKIQTDSQTISYKVSETANYGGMEYELFGWFLFKLNKAEGGVNVGKFMRKLFAPGLRKPPLDMNKIKQIESDLEFGINEVDWPEDDDMLSMSKSRISSKKGKKGKKKKKKKKTQE